LKRILYRKFVQQTEHRIRIENRVVWTDTIKSIGGLIAAFIISMTAIIGGVVVAVHNAPLAGGILSLSGLAAVVGSFLYASQKRESEETDAGEQESDS
jgi:hypothetical protein